MKNESRFKKRLYTTVVALGLALGSVGVAAATSGSTPADEVDLQEPAYTGSVQTPAGDENVTEAEEAGQLEGLAAITADEAAAAAAKSVPGEVAGVELDNENGSVVYSVEITAADGSEIDVKVDAGNGDILNQQADDDGDEADELDNDDVQHENEHEGENDPDGGHED